MIEGLRPYPDYKDSNLLSVSTIPRHWQSFKLKYVARTLGGLTPSKRMAAYWNGMMPWVTPKDMKTRVIRDSRNHISDRALRNTGISVVPAPAVLFVVRGMILARTFPVAETRVPVTVNQDMKALVPKEGIESSFLALLLAGIESEVLELVSEAGHGTRCLRTEKWANLAVPIPSRDEQAAIVRFLDHANHRIDCYIRAKRKLIALLNEQKQAIIQGVVTGGLEPKAPMKDSGVPWIGEIPAHWEAPAAISGLRLIQTGPFGSQLHSHEYVNGGVPVINPIHIKEGRVVPASDVTVSCEKARVLGRHRFHEGDIVVARRGDLGRCAVVAPSGTGWICGTGSLLLRCRLEAFVPQYFQAVFSSAGVCAELAAASIGSTMANLNAGMVARLRLPRPPLEEQLRIVEAVSVVASRFAAATALIEKEIGIVREYRTRLIADVVAGQLDVREAARNFPDVNPEELEAEPTESEAEADLDPAESEAA